MIMTIRALTLFTALMASAWVTQAQAEFEIKRLKCSEFQHVVYHNRSDTAEKLTFQIVRDGCIPKTGDYLLSPSGNTPIPLDRIGRMGPVYRTDIAATGVAIIQFQNFFGSPTRGTFDVRIDMD